MIQPRIDTQRAQLTVSAFGPDARVLAGVTGVTYSVDVDRTPYTVATITLANPGPAVLSTLDPTLRPRPRILVDLLQRFETSQPGTRTLADVTAHLDAVTLADVTPDQPATLSSFDASLPAVAPIVSNWGTVIPVGDSTFSQIYKELYIVDVDVDLTGSTVTITATSGEFLLDDKVALRPAPKDYGTLPLFDLVATILATVGGTMVSAIPNPGTVGGDLTIMQPGVTCAAFLEPLLAVYGLRLYAESLTQFSVAPIGDVTGFGQMSTIVLDYKAGMSGAGYALTAIGSAGSASWFDGAILIYNWTDPAGVARTAVDCYPLDGTHTRGYVQTLTSAYPGPGAAQGIVRRSRKRGRTYTVKQVSNFFVQPGWDATLTLPNIAATALKVTAIEWHHPAGEMTLTLQTQIGA